MRQVEDVAEFMHDSRKSIFAKAPEALPGRYSPLNAALKANCPQVRRNALAVRNAVRVSNSLHAVADLDRDIHNAAHFPRLKRDVAGKHV